LNTKEASELIEGAKEADVSTCREVPGRRTPGVPGFRWGREEETFNLLRKAGLPVTGQVTLYDGRTVNRSTVK